MQTPLFFTLNCLASLLKRSSGRAESPVVIEATPLDPVERLHRNGSTFPVMMEFSRLGW
jgi:hypothetical protein